MPPDMKVYKYYIIHFLDLPTTSSAENYAIVPYAWLRNFLINENKVYVAYPIEDYMLTEKRVANLEPFDDKWKLYLAELMLGADSYSEAQTHLITVVYADKNLELSNDNSNGLLEGTNTDHSVNPTRIDQNTMENSTETVKQKDMVSQIQKDKNSTASCSTNINIAELGNSNPSENNKVKIISNELITKPFKKRTHSMEGGSLEPKSNQKRSKHESSNETANDTVIDEPSRSEENIEQILPPIQLSISKVKSGHKIEYAIKKPNDPASSNTDSSSPEQLSTSLIENKEENILNSFEHLYEEAEQVQTILKKFEKCLEVFRVTLDENVQSFEKVYDFIDDFVKLYSSDDDSDSDSDYEDDSDSSSNDESDECDNFETQRKSKSSNKINKNSRWTLKYKKKEKGTSELMVGSGIYISNEGLLKCQQQANRETNLAGMLCEEVFTKEALLKCSLTGNPSFGKSVGPLRPALDKNGVRAVFDFVKQFGESKNWEDKTEREIKQYIASFLHKLRKTNRKN